MPTAWPNELHDLQETETHQKGDEIMTKIAAAVLLLGALACAPRKLLTPAAPAVARCGTDTECMELCRREGGVDCHLPYTTETN